MIFETHAHYDDKMFDEDRESLLESMQEAGIGRIVNIGADLVSTASSIALAEKYPFIYAAAGVHPSDAAQLNEHTFQWLSEQTAHEKVVAVGEIGLDYYWGADRKKKQQDYFEAQMQLARELNLPVSLHDRDAHGDLFEIVLRYPEVRGVVHAFSGSEEMARELWRRGWYIGFGGVVTFKNAERVRRVAASVPLEFLLTETDCPYMAPVPHRGEINNSLYMCESVNMMASLHGVTPAEMEEVTERNARTLFEI